MKVFIEGIYIPNTNEWWIDENWTVKALVTDVVKVATAKQDDPNNYQLYDIDGNLLDEEIIINKKFEDNYIFQIKRK